MSQLLSGFINRVFLLKVHGPIDQKLAHNITRGLQSCWPYRPSALLVSINSPGGSIIQAKDIADLLRLYSNRFNVPIVTFAEDQCLGSANLLLTTGVKSYANNFSMLGDVGFTWSRLWYDRFGEQYNIKQEFVHAGQNKVKFNAFEPLQPNSQQWAKNYIYQLEHELQMAVTANRGEHFTKKGVSKQILGDKIFAAGLIDPEEAVKLGFIDGIRSVDQELQDRHSTSAVKEINTVNKSWRERLTAAV